MKEKKLIAFDLYDTCFTFTVPQERLSYKQIFSDLGIPMDKRIELRNVLLTSHKTMEDVLSTLIPSAQIDRFIDTYYANLRKEVQSVQLFPETQPTLSVLREKGYKIAAVSNLAQSYIEPVNSLLPKSFDYEVFSCDTGLIKPDAKVFEYLQNISGYMSDEILMVGDSISADVQGSINAGITPIHIERNKKNLKKNSEFLQINSLSDLLNILHGVR